MADEPTPIVQTLPPLPGIPIPPVIHSPSTPTTSGSGSGPENVIFQIVTIPFLSVPTCSTSSPHDILKLSLKKIDQTYRLGVSNIETFYANKKSHFTCYFEPYLQITEHIHMVCFKHVKMF